MRFEVLKVMKASNVVLFVVTPYKILFKVRDNYLQYHTAITTQKTTIDKFYGCLFL